MMWYVFGTIVLVIIVGIIIKSLQSVSTYDSSTRSQLSREELKKFNRESVDPQPWGPIVRGSDNVDLTDEELCRRIEQRIKEGKPTALLRLEYRRRLNERNPSDEWWEEDWF